MVECPEEEEAARSLSKKKPTRRKRKSVDKSDVGADEDADAIRARSKSETASRSRSRSRSLSLKTGPGAALDDEPGGTEPVLARKRKALDKPATMTRAVPLPRRPARTAQTSKREGKGKAKAADGSDTEGDDDPVFVSETFKALSSKYTYVSSGSSGELHSGGSNKKEAKEEERPYIAPLPLLPDIEPREAPPIPPWLPAQAKDLRNLQKCPVCQKKFTSKENSGPTRWVRAL